MKNTILYAAILCLLASCNFIAGSKSNETDSTKINSADSSQAFTPVRDETITAANGYSDLFLDSTALENFIAQQKIDGSVAQNLRNFYKVRNYEYAWFSSDGLTEQGKEFWNLYQQNNKESNKDKSGQKLTDRVDSLFEKDTLQINQADTSYRRTELALSQQYVQYAQANGNSNALLYAIPRKKMEVMQWADSLLHKQKDTAQFTGNTAYSALKQQLSKYDAIAQNGGWQTINWKGKLAKGKSAPAVTELKKRLQLTEDYPKTDTSAKYNDTLMNAVKMVQAQYGLKQTGIANDSLITALNVPVQQRIEQIIINLNRAQWTPSGNTQGNRILVNIPTQMLEVYGDTGKVMEMPVVVGKEGASTVMFNGSINQVVFSPEWTIPQSIVQNEVLPKMKADPNYLKKQHMEVIGKYSDSIPEIRELPNPKNPLGKIKFLFPNNYEIYLHDTPDKTAFQRNDRTMSHGCIRVAQPEKLAQYILQDQSDWNAQKIQQAMNSGKQQKVDVKKQVPVTISYYTAWVDKNGKLNFRNDVYQLDHRTASRLFTNA
jgi:murein L,D-transpeptidase YcbB/YkuD